MDTIPPLSDAAIHLQNLYKEGLAIILTQKFAVHEEVRNI